MSKIQLTNLLDQDFNPLIKKLDSNLAQQLSFETCPYNVKKKSKSKDTRVQQHYFSLAENYKNKAQAFIEELTQEPFSQNTNFQIQTKGNTKQVSVFSWLDNLISLKAPDKDFKEFLELSENAGFDKSIKKLHRINKGQFCEDRVELALNLLLDNAAINGYERFKQHSKEDKEGKDFRIVIDDETQIDIDVKAGNSSSSNEIKLTKVQHKSLTELVADLVELCQKAS